MKIDLLEGDLEEGSVLGPITDIVKIFQLSHVELEEVFDLLEKSNLITTKNIGGQKKRVVRKNGDGARSSKIPISSTSKWMFHRPGIPEYLSNDLDRALVSPRDKTILLNPATLNPFVFGDHNKDSSKRFFEYGKNTKNSNGLKLLTFITVEQFKRIKKAKNSNEVDVVIKKVLYELKKEKRNRLIKRLNPKTGKPFQYGDKDEKGRFFVRYLSSPQRRDPRLFTERWEKDEVRFNNYRINVVLGNVRRRVEEKSLPFDLDAEYLLGILPKNLKCPIFKTKMVWGGKDADNSPSLDRIIPSKGYTKGNVRWTSNIANTLKSDRNFDIIEKIYFDMKKLRQVRK